MGGHPPFAGALTGGVSNRGRCPKQPAGLPIILGGRPPKLLVIMGGHPLFAGALTGGVSNRGLLVSNRGRSPNLPNLLGGCPPEPPVILGGRPSKLPIITGGHPPFAGALSGGG